MKTYTETRIELGQDINNTWALIAANQTTDRMIYRDNLYEAFQELFPIVQKCSQWARAKSIMTDEELRTATPRTPVQEQAAHDLDKIARTNSGFGGRA